MDKNQHEHNKVFPWQRGSHLTGQVRKHVNNPQPLLQHYISEGMTILDVGCGMGFLTLIASDLTGASGTVIAVDLQPEMLAGLKKNAEKAHKTNITFHQCAKDALGIEQWNESIDLALVYWMLHEVPNPERLIREIYAALADKGMLLFVEPARRVSKDAFQSSLDMIVECGFSIVDLPKVSISHAAVLQKNQA